MHRHLFLLRVLVYLTTGLLLQTAHAQPDNRCAEKEYNRFQQVYQFLFMQPGVENAKEPVVIVTNTNGDNITGVDVLFIRRNSSYSLTGDTLVLVPQPDGRRFIFPESDSVVARYGGTYIISAPGYFTQQLRVNHSFMKIDLPVVLGRRGDLFIPVYRQLFPVTCANEFISFGSVYVSQTQRRVLNEKPFVEPGCDSTLANWLNRMATRFNLGSIRGPAHALPSVGFQHNYTRFYGLNLPADNNKRNMVLAALAADTTYKPELLHYLFLPEQSFAFGSTNKRVVFYFPSQTPDTAILQWIGEAGFEPEQPIVQQGHYPGYSDFQKRIITRYKGMLNLDMVRQASTLIGRATHFAFNDY